MKHPPLKIYDTTLRDGTQGEGISFSVTDKLLITERLDHFGVDYIEGGLQEDKDQQVLAFERDIETAIYNTIPHQIERMLKRQPLKCPVSFIGGTRSREMRLAGMNSLPQVTKGRLMMLDGSHLFPMEKPLATAAAIEAALRNLGA